MRNYALVLTHEPWIPIRFVNRTATACSVLEDVAFSIRSTVIAVEARIHTLTINTGLVSGALGVASTANNFTATMRVTLQARWAAALSTVILRIALCTDGTWIVHIAWVNAHSIFTHLGQWALFINTASSCNRKCLFISPAYDRG